MWNGHLFTAIPLDETPILTSLVQQKGRVFNPASSTHSTMRTKSFSAAALLTTVNTP